MTPFALPPDLVPQVLIEHVRVDEHSLSTSRFIAGEPVDQLADRIADHWRAQAPVLQARHGEWRIVSRHLGSRIDTVQLRATGAGSEGFASSWQPLPAAPAPAQSLSAMLPPGCEIVRQLAHV
ncbi:MAG TPA: hypothetical protein VM491_00245, partial [Burkholderiaceae bacterium]|nr:hypothetical protein [Burkholderiaceae bacterium]